MAILEEKGRGLGEVGDTVRDDYLNIDGGRRKERRKGEGEGEGEGRKEEEGEENGVSK